MFFANVFTKTASQFGIAAAVWRPDSESEH